MNALLEKEHTAPKASGFDQSHFLKISGRVPSQHGLIRQASASGFQEVANIPPTDTAVSKYNNVVNELVTTEKTYLADLLTCKAVSTFI